MSFKILLFILFFSPSYAQESPKYATPAMVAEAQEAFFAEFQKQKMIFQEELSRHKRENQPSISQEIIGRGIPNSEDENGKRRSFMNDFLKIYAESFQGRRLDTPFLKPYRDKFVIEYLAKKKLPRQENLADRAAAKAFEGLRYLQGINSNSGNPNGAAIISTSVAQPPKKSEASTGGYEEGVSTSLSLDAK